MIRTVFALVLVVSYAAPALAQASAPPRPAEQVYKETCQVCHMPDGNAAIKNMNFADGVWLHGNSVKQIAKVITDGVPGTAMMSFKTRMSDAEIQALASYVRAFDKKLKAAPAAKK